MRYKIGDLAKLLSVSTNTVPGDMRNMGYISAGRDENSDGLGIMMMMGIFSVPMLKCMAEKYGFFT